MLIKKNFYFFLVGIFFLFGCGSEYEKFVTTNTLPQHIKKIAVMKFKDIVNKPDFQDKLYFTVKDKFTTDRRVELVEMETADAVLVGQISRYLLQPIEYNKDKIVMKYSLWVWIDISLYDATTKQILWTENKLEAKVEYNTLSTASGFLTPTTESEAQNVAIDKLANDIVIRTIDGWFAVSGVSEKIYS